MYAKLVLFASDGVKPVKGSFAERLDNINPGFGIWRPINFLHSEERVSAEDAAKSSGGKFEFGIRFGKSFISLSYLALLKERGIGASGCGIEREEDDASGFPVDSM